MYSSGSLGNKQILYGDIFRNYRKPNLEQRVLIEQIEGLS